MKVGMVIINKEAGWTSQNIVSKVKKILNIKKAGHIGTLDPLATGVLPVLIGDATKLSKYLIEHDKTYIATVQLGQKKDTGDEEGRLIEEAKVGILDKQTVENIFKQMQGKQQQAPHPYSAVKMNGQKLYEYARKGEKIEIPKREIEIYSIKLLELDHVKKQISFEVSCSKGTYIRVLCEEIAEKLGTVGFMKFLQRTKVDKFSLENAVKLENLTEDDIISVEELCKKNYEEIELNDRKLELFLNGVMLTVFKEDGIYNIYHQQKFIGLGVVKNGLLKRDVVVKRN